jgi:hypothetical protein
MSPTIMVRRVERVGGRVAWRVGGRGRPAGVVMGAWAAAEEGVLPMMRSIEVA